MDFSIRHATNNVWYGVFAHLDKLGIRHGFAARLGGVSSEPYHSLNLVFRDNDNPDNVMINRQRFCEAIGVDLAKAVGGHQVHGDRVAVVTPDDMGRGITGATGLADTDALITNQPDIPLMVLFADCVPVLFADPVRKVVGACHAGWRGTAADIAAKTVGAMERHFGTNPADCLVGLGPAIGPCCYEVDEKVIAKFRTRFGWWKSVTVPRGAKWYLDLWETNRRQLLDAGIPEVNIKISNVCTACNTSLFFSYRAENGDTGNLAAVIAL